MDSLETACSEALQQPGVVGVVCVDSQGLNLYSKGSVPDASGSVAQVVRAAEAPGEPPLQALQELDLAVVVAARRLVPREERRGLAEQPRMQRVDERGVGRALNLRHLKKKEAEECRPHSRTRVGGCGAAPRWACRARW